MTGVKQCEINTEKICDACGDCDRCDLDDGKTCDNCCKCIGMERDFISISIHRIACDVEESVSSHVDERQP